MSKGRPIDQNRAAAKVLGLVRYNGAACKRGHAGERYTSTGACVPCVTKKGI